VDYLSKQVLAYYNDDDKERRRVITESRADAVADARRSLITIEQQVESVISSEYALTPAECKALRATYAVAAERVEAVITLLTQDKEFYTAVDNKLMRAASEIHRLRERLKADKDA
jgi:hypothetical protein